MLLGGGRGGRAAATEGHVTVSDVNAFLDQLSQMQDAKHQDRLFRDLLRRCGPAPHHCDPPSPPPPCPLPPPTPLLRRSFARARPAAQGVGAGVEVHCQGDPQGAQVRGGPPAAVRLPRAEPVHIRRRRALRSGRAPPPAGPPALSAEPDGGAGVRGEPCLLRAGGAEGGGRVDRAGAGTFADGCIKMAM